MNIRKILLTPIFAIGFACGGIVSVFADTACANLPSGYTQLEYIQSNGNQWINTGIYSSGIGLKSEVQLQLTTSSTSEMAIVGRNYNRGYEVYFTRGNTIGVFHLTGQAAIVSLNYTTGTTYTITSEMTSNSVTHNVNGTQASYNGSMDSMDSAEVCLFRHNYNYYISAKLYYAKLWNNGTLVRDFVPAKRNSDNVLGMYDKISGNFYTNAGSGSFTAGSDICTTYGITYNLGGEMCYARLEYLQSSGSQFINTGIYSSGPGLKSEVQLQLTTSSTSEMAIVGRNAGAGYEVYFTRGNTIGVFHASYGQSALVSLNYTTGTTYTITSEMTSNSVTNNVNGTQASYNGSMNSMDSAEVCLFRHNYDYYISAKLYYAKLWNNGTLVRDFVPAKRNSDNVLGMYDSVSGDFFTNAGSGTFTSGPVVSAQNAGCASNYVNAPVSYVSGTGATINGVPTRDGYTFAGWCTDSALTNCAMTQTISSSATGNKTFYAKWTNSSANTITLTFDGVSTTPSQCTYGGTFVPPTPAARPGYIFTGWKVKTVNP